MIETVYETELIPVAVNISPAVIQRRQQLLDEGRCLGCEKKLSPGENVRCGQCDACYSATRRNIQKRRVTKTELIREGKLLKPTKGGRKPRNKFTAELAER